ncbi:MAG: hypothetical protein HY354_00715, partial [Planctomycetes bacterium]|nr:hypothetical protein [Planctomycetota bacterium]
FIPSLRRREKVNTIYDLPFIPSFARRGLRGGYNNILKTIIIGLLIITLGVSSFRLIIKHKWTLPLQVQVMNYITDNFDKLSTRLYCWDTKRLFDYYAFGWDIRRARNINDLEYDINSSLVIPETVLCTSQVEGIVPAIGGLRLLKRFRSDRYIDNPCSELVLYNLDIKHGFLLAQE